MNDFAHSKLSTFILGSNLRNHITIDILVRKFRVLLAGTDHLLLHWRHFWLLNAFQDTTGGPLGNWVSHLSPRDVHSFLIKLILTSRPILGGWLLLLAAFIHLVLAPCEAEPFEVHLSESVVRCPSSWLIEVFLEVRVSGSVVDHTLHEETFVPLRLRLHCSSSVGLPDSNVGESLSRRGLDNLRLLDYNWLGLRDVG